METDKRNMDNKEKENNNKIECFRSKPKSRS